MCDAKEVELRHKARRTQLSILQLRIMAHGTRLWQLPLSFVAIEVLLATGILRLELSAIPLNAYRIILIPLIILSISGAFVIWAMVNARASYDRTAKEMDRIESELDLKPTTKPMRGDFIPYIQLQIIASLIPFCIATLIAAHLLGYPVLSMLVDTVP